MSNHVYRLMERHRQLDDQLRQSLSRRMVDSREIARLKKLKLAVKDRLARMMRGPAQSV